MNEIKIRAWNEPLKKMIYGPTDDMPSPSWILCLPDEVPKMLGSGLKDKNGVEIFTGDIVKGVFEYQPGLPFEKQMHITGEIIISRAEFVVKSLRLHLGLKFFFESEIIGNIYANPELLPS